MKRSGTIGRIPRSTGRRRTAVRRGACIPAALLLIIVLAAVGCARRSEVIRNDLKPRTERPAATLAEFLSLTPEARRERREEADAILPEWRDLDRRLQDFSRHRHHSWHRPEHSQRWGYGVMAATGMLRDILGLDPTRADLWASLAHYADAMGDRDLVLKAADRTFATLDLLPQDGRSATARDAALLAAWNCRDRGRFAAAESWLEKRPAGSGKQEEARLLRALLLADNGRIAEARRAAALIGAIEIPVYRDYIWSRVDGWATEPSRYVRNWIEAMCWIRAGHPDMARLALGDVPVRKAGFPYARRYLNDAGLVAELAGDVDEASRFYSLSAYHNPHRFYLPMAGFSCEPLIAGRPQRGLPYFLGPGQTCVGGSLFAYGAQMVAECSIHDPGPERDELARRAETVLDACRARGIDPDLALALRGRLYSYLGRNDEAWRDLLAARAELESAGRPDARTFHLLGVLALQDGRGNPLPMLQAAVGLDPDLAPAWRALGAVLSEAGIDSAAVRAFDRAVALEPDVVDGWFNRGLHHARNARWESALADLRLAQRLDGDNDRVDDLVLKVVEKSGIAAESVPPTVPPAAIETGMLRRAAAAGTSEIITPETILIDSGDLAELEKTFAASGTPADRARLGRGYRNTGRSVECRDLLAPHWPDGLSAEERRMLLSADRALGDCARALELSQGAATGEIVSGDSEFWTLVALICFEGGLVDAGREALAVAIRLDPGNQGLRTLAGRYDR